MFSPGVVQSSTMVVASDNPVRLKDINVLDIGLYKSSDNKLTTLK